MIYISFIFLSYSLQIQLASLTEGVSYNSIKMDGSNSFTLVYKENMDHQDVEGGKDELWT